MLLLPEYNRPILIENVNDPLTVDRHWTFSAKHLDFFLTPIIYIEEYVGPVITLQIQEFEFNVPANWFMVVCERETTFVDVLPVSGLLGKEFDAFIFTMTDSKTRSLPIKALDLIPEQKCVYPVLQKGYGLVHPVGKEYKTEAVLNCIISPFDLFQKMTTNVTIGDILY